MISIENIPKTVADLGTMTSMTVGQYSSKPASSTALVERATSPSTDAAYVTAAGGAGL